MSYLVIARKWRPQTFEDVVGQSHVTRTLQNAISAGRVAHAYLFTGPRGVGKTSTARILAKALNCEKGPTPHPCLACPACLEIAGPGSVDVVEIDGASNNSVDDVRSLREKVMYTGVRDRHKVYIIDEVHMLTPQAFNALLKTLEEPPAHVVFIFATTEANKVPTTILSRTQRFDFRRVGAADVAAQLAKILAAEGLAASQEALQLVARAGEGSVRDSQTLLDQVISYALGAGEKQALRAEDVLAVLGGVQEGQAWSALRSALRGDTQSALAWIQEQFQRGADLRQVLDAFEALLRGLVLLKASPSAELEMDLLPETVQALKDAAPDLGLSRLFTALKSCGEAQQHFRYTSQTRLVVELLLIKFAPASPAASLGEIVDELRDLEQRFRLMPEGAAAGSPAPAPSNPASTAGVASSAPASFAPAPAAASGSGSAAASAEAKPAGVSVPPPVSAVPPTAARASASASGLPAGATQPSAPTAASTASLPQGPAQPAAPAASAPASALPAGSSQSGGPIAAPRAHPAEAGEPVPAVVSLDEPAISGGVPSVERLRQEWEAVVADVQNESLNLASAAKDAGLLAVEGGTVSLKAVNGFQRKVLEEPAERLRLERALSKRFGMPLRSGSSSPRRRRARPRRAPSPATRMSSGCSRNGRN